MGIKKQSRKSGTIPFLKQSVKKGMRKNFTHQNSDKQKKNAVKSSVSKHKKRYEKIAQDKLQKNAFVPDNDSLKRSMAKTTDSSAVKRIIPWGRTLSTSDFYLPHSKVTKGMKEHRTVVVIETNENDELAVVPLSGSAGNNRTRLKKYQQGGSYFKHFVEIEDDAGDPIIIGEKFRENHENQDVSQQDVHKIRFKVFENSQPSKRNKEKMASFRSRTKK